MIFRIFFLFIFTISNFSIANAKDKELACEKFLAVINEQICDLSEVGDEWFGFDSTLDRVLRDSYYEDAFDNLDEDSDEYDDW